VIFTCHASAANATEIGVRWQRHRALPIRGRPSHWIDNDGANVAPVSVVVPAHQEAAELPRTLANLHAALADAGVEYELIVVDNASTDSTADVAAHAGARVVSEPYRQISRARNTGAAAATGQWLLFVDADTWPSAELLERTIAELAAGVAGGGALVALERVPNRIYRFGLRLWNAASARLCLAAGCYLFARKEAFDAVGGFDERFFAGDEVFLSRQLKRWARAHERAFGIIESPPVLSSARKADWFTPRHHVLTMLLVLLCPPAMRSRRLMRFWYKRPESTADEQGR